MNENDRFEFLKTAYQEAIKRLREKTGDQWKHVLMEDLEKIHLNDSLRIVCNQCGEYSNIYFIVNPIFSSAAWPSHWGDLGVPEIYHFNSDVQVVMRHPGQRIDGDTVAFPAGSHTISWIADRTNLVVSYTIRYWMPSGNRSDSRLTSFATACTVSSALAPDVR